MITLQARGLGKRYNRHWLFRQAEISIGQGQALAVTGANGSGKSTLLQMLAGLLPPSEGSVQWLLHGQPIDGSQWFRHMGIASPYMDLPEELTLLELLRFHQRFKPFINSWQAHDLVQALRFSGHEHKQVALFSSGMKQRLKLGLAIFSQNDILLLDEPTANMDAPNAAWYAETLPTLLPNRLVIVFSNDPAEYAFCNQVLHLQPPA